MDDEFLRADDGRLEITRRSADLKNIGHAVVILVREHLHCLLILPPDVRWHVVDAVVIAAIDGDSRGNDRHFMNPTIRMATARDVAAMAALLGQLGYPTTPSQMQIRMRAIDDDPGYATFVAETNGSVVGFVGARLDSGYEYDGLQARILALVVEEAHRGAGIGRGLVGAAERWADERGAVKIMVNTANHRSATHEFYKSIGYEATGLRFVKPL